MGQGVKTHPHEMLQSLRLLRVAVSMVSVTGKKMHTHNLSGGRDRLR